MKWVPNRGASTVWLERRGNSDWLWSGVGQDCTEVFPGLSWSCWGPSVLIVSAMRPLTYASVFTRQRSDLNHLCTTSPKTRYDDWLNKQRQHLDRIWKKSVKGRKSESPGLSQGCEGDAPKGVRAVCHRRGGRRTSCSSGPWQEGWSSTL